VTEPERSASADIDLRTGDRPSIGELLNEVSKDITDLMRQELALARAEATQSATRASKGAGMLAGAGVAVHFALFFASIAGWWAIGNELGRGWSGLIVMAVWVVVALALSLLGRKEIKAIRGLHRTAESVKKIPPALKGNEE
jgi:hypothetical protein